jgi:hypothetical protein
MSVEPPDAGVAALAVQEQPLSLTDLPANLLELIVSLLPKAEDLARVDQVATIFHVPPPPAAGPAAAGPPARRFSVVAQALLMRTPRRFTEHLSEMAHERQELRGPSGATQQLLESEVARRYIFFKGKIRGKVSDEDYDEDIHQDEDAMDPFGEYPKIHGHLELPVGWEGEVAGLYTIDGNPHDDGMGPIIFGITGTMTPDKLKLSFQYNSTVDPSDDDGPVADINVSSRIQEDVASFLMDGRLTPSKCRLRGGYYLDWPNEGETGTVKLMLTSIQWWDLERLEGKWSRGWRDDDEDDDLERDLAKAIRKGPHPSLYPRSLLASLAAVEGYACELGGRAWPADEDEATWKYREQHTQEISTWLQQRPDRQHTSSRDWRDPQAMRRDFYGCF